MLVHSVRSSSIPDNVSVRAISCNSATCICDGNSKCQGWSDHPVAKTYNIDQWVAFKDDSTTILGQVQQQEGSLLKVKCVHLEPSGSGLYQWSNVVKKIAKSSIVCKLAKPRAMKRKNGLLKLTETTLNKIKM